MFSIISEPFLDVSESGVGRCDISVKDLSRAWAESITSAGSPKRSDDQVSCDRIGTRIGRGLEGNGTVVLEPEDVRRHAEDVGIAGKWDFGLAAAIECVDRIAVRFAVEVGRGLSRSQKNRR